MLRMRLSLLLVCPLALASAVSAQIYVDPQNGSDSTGDGSQSSPYQTLTFAVPQAPSSSGEIVLFNGSGGAAVASEATGENFPITISKELTIRGEKLGAALIESTSASASPEIFSFVGGNDPNLSYYLELTRGTRALSPSMRARVASFLRTNAARVHRTRLEALPRAHPSCRASSGRLLAAWWPHPPSGRLVAPPAFWPLGSPTMACRAQVQCCLDIALSDAWPDGRWRCFCLC